MQKNLDVSMPAVYGPVPVEKPVVEVEAGVEKDEETPVKRGPGRPKKVVDVESDSK